MLARLHAGSGYASLSYPCSDSRTACYTLTFQYCTDRHCCCAVGRYYCGATAVPDPYNPTATWTPINASMLLLATSNYIAPATIAQAGALQFVYKTSCTGALMRVIVTGMAAPSLSCSGTGQLPRPAALPTESYGRWVLAIGSHTIAYPPRGCETVM